jgi:nucleotide-binding universal stress UspA family protein
VVPSPIRSILLPTDFSDEALVAFAHALRLALRFKANLDILHVEPHNDQADWHWAPSVLETLRRWNAIPSDATPAALARIGISARRSVAAGIGAEEAILREMAAARADLIVMARHGRSGLDRWLQPSVATPVAVAGAVPVLLIPPRSLGFVDVGQGTGSLQRILVPVDHRPHPGPGYDAACLFARAMGGDQVHLATLHVGPNHPEREMLRGDPGWRVDHWNSDDGPVVDRILEAATTWNPDLVVMVTEGRTSFLDSLTGSTVDRLIPRLNTPLLLVPSGWDELAGGAQSGGGSPPA